MIKIEDNFLGQKEFDELQTLMMGDGFVWSYSDGIDYGKELNKFQFTHVFYSDNVPEFAYIEKLTPIFNKIKSMSFWRIKANLLTKTSNIIENAFHVDIGNLEDSPEKLKQWTTSIFYVNTNNGYTKFEDGTIVESVANRLVSFPSNMKHTGTSCTDEKTRVVINFNYFSKYFK